MVIGVAGGTLPLTFGTLPFEAQHHPPLLGPRDRARLGLGLARTGRIHAHVEHFALERAAEACQRMRERSLNRAGRDHAQRLRPAGQTAPPTASMCRRVNAREPSM
jgi:hypothetical protein